MKKKYENLILITTLFDPCWDCSLADRWPDYWHADLSSPFWPLTIYHRPVVNIDLYWATCMWPDYCIYLLLNRPVRTIVDRMATFKGIWPELARVHVTLYLYLTLFTESTCMKYENFFLGKLSVGGWSRITNCAFGSIYRISIKWKLISR